MSMRGVIGGILAGGVVSAVGLGVASVLTELPAGQTPPAAPLVDGPVVDAPMLDAPLLDPLGDPVARADTAESPVRSPVSRVIVDDPVAAGSGEPAARAPLADTDPLHEPNVISIEGALDAPETGDMDVAIDVTMASPIEPVLPNPQAMAPTIPMADADLTLSTTPAPPPQKAPEQAVAVIEPDVAIVEDMVEENPAPQADDADTLDVDPDVGDAPDAAVVAVENAGQDTQMEQPAEDTLTASETPDAARDELAGDETALPTDRDTDVIADSPTGSQTDSPIVSPAPPALDAPDVNALAQYAAQAGDTAGKPLLSFVLIDDGSMFAAATAALADLPFPVTIALDPGANDVVGLMQEYRDSGFEVAVLANLPDGAQPTDAEAHLQTVFATLPETIALLDIGLGGLQADRAVTEQAMEVLAAQGRGFVTVGEGENMASRAAEAAGVPAAVVYRDIDSDNQDARVVRRFVGQAAFRAGQDSGVVLVGRVRPDTISALILWGSSNRDDDVAIVPLSAVLLAQ